jgi:SOS-response transcriptional repressor LexA
MNTLVLRPDRDAVALKIKELRKARGWNQTELAEACGVTQALVSLWEKGQGRPGPSAMAKIAQLSVEPDRQWWIQQAGLAGLVNEPIPQGLHRMIPMLRDAAAAGTPRVIEEGGIEFEVPFPVAWLPRAGKLYAIRVAGDSMSPVIEPGTVVIVDVSQREPEKLLGRMVVAREGNGVTVKWLRQDHGTFLLVPQHVSLRHPVRIMSPSSDLSIVGVVVKWISEPPPVRK